MKSRLNYESIWIFKLRSLTKVKKGIKREEDVVKKRCETATTTRRNIIPGMMGTLT